MKGKPRLRSASPAGSQNNNSVSSANNGSVTTGSGTFIQKGNG